MTGGPPARDVDEVMALYDEFADHRYDETVSQLDHGLQCAALARRDGAPDALVVAALLHDVGHLLHLRDGGRGPVPEDLHHEDRGADYLAGVFGPEVTEPVRLHVRAKRYLVAVEPELLDRLSPASVSSLERQGGPLRGSELDDFRAERAHADAVALRRWDDAGKVEDLTVPPFEDYADLLRSRVRP